MSIKILEDYILKLFVTELESQTNIEKSNLFGIELDYKTIDTYKKEITISADCKVAICLLKDVHGRIVTSGVFILLDNNYYISVGMTNLINTSLDEYELISLTLSTEAKNVVVIKKNKYNHYYDVTIIKTKLVQKYGQKYITLQKSGSILFSCLVGSTGVLLHDGSGLLLLGDPLQKGRVVTEENGYSATGSIMIFKYVEEESLEYVDEIHTHTGDIPHFNNCFIVDPEKKTNVIIYYTADGKGINTSINMKYLLDNIDNTRDKLFNRSLKSNYK